MESWHEDVQLEKPEGKISLKDQPHSRVQTHYIIKSMRELFHGNFGRYLATLAVRYDILKNNIIAYPISALNALLFIIIWVKQYF